MGMSAKDFPSAKAEDKQIVLNIILHGSEFSRHARTLPVCLRWAVRYMEEAFRQGDEEIRQIAGIPILRKAKGLNFEGPVRLHRRICPADARAHGADLARHAGADHAAVARKQDVLSQEERWSG